MYYAAVYSDWSRATDNTVRWSDRCRACEKLTWILSSVTSRCFFYTTVFESLQRTLSTQSDRIVAGYLSTINPLFRRDEATDLKYLRATGNYVKRYCSALTSVAELGRFKICTFPGYLRFPADVSRESMERAGAIYHFYVSGSQIFLPTENPNRDLSRLYLFEHC